MYKRFFLGFTGVAIFEHNWVNIYRLMYYMDSDCSETSLNGFVDF